jgi:hypothetical protein
VLYFLYILFSALFFGIIILFVLYFFLQKKFFRGKRYIVFCFVCVILITLILWCFTFISFYEHIRHLENVSRKRIFGSTEKELTTVVGQTPTDVFYSKDSDGKPMTVVIYKYCFPPFDYCFEFTFINDNLGKVEALYK